MQPHSSNNISTGCDKPKQQREVVGIHQRHHLESCLHVAGEVIWIFLWSKHWYSRLRRSDSSAVPVFRATRHKLSTSAASFHYYYVSFSLIKSSVSDQTCTICLLLLWDFIIAHQISHIEDVTFSLNHRDRESATISQFNRKKINCQRFWQSVHCFS